MEVIFDQKIARKWLTVKYFPNNRAKNARVCLKNQARQPDEGSAMMKKPPFMKKTSPLCRSFSLLHIMNYDYFKRFRAGMGRQFHRRSRLRKRKLMRHKLPHVQLP